MDYPASGVCTSCTPACRDLKSQADALNPLLEPHLQALRASCQRHHVRTLPLFDPARSDFDFLVEFGAVSPGEYVGAYFGRVENSEQLFGRHVDLVVDSTIKHPYVRQSVEATKSLVYARHADARLSE